MELLVIVLNKPEYLKEILMGFVEEDLNGATVIDSAGMGHLVAEHVPFFSQFASLGDDDQSNHSKTIFTVLNCCEDREKAVKIVEQIVGDVDSPDSVFMFSVPVNFIKGLSIRSCGECE